MALLNTADALYLGAQPVDRVYLGPNEVWSAAPPFDPVSLFSNGEIGTIIDPSDFSTMFQDSAGTIPVTAVGQPVGRIVPKAGGTAFVQATATSRPVLREEAGLHYLDFDGVDDGMSASGPSPLGTEVTVAVGVLQETYKSNQGTGAYVGRYDGDITSVFWAIRWSGSPDSVRFYNIDRQEHAPAPFGVPHAYVMKARSSGVGGMLDKRVDGVSYGTATRANDRTYSNNQSVRLMSHVFAGGEVDGRLYAVAYINRILTEPETTDLERWVAKKSGVALP